MNLGDKWELFFPSERGYANRDAGSYYISGGRVYIFHFERHNNPVISTSLKKYLFQKLFPDLPQLIEALAIPSLTMLQSDSYFKNGLGVEHDFTLFLLKTQVTLHQNCSQHSLKI
jgi:hypothetical protein